MSGEAVAGGLVAEELRGRFAEDILSVEPAADGVPTVVVRSERLPAVARFLHEEVGRPYRMLFDLTAIDERSREHGDGERRPQFSVVYHLISFERNEDIRLKAPLFGAHPTMPSIVDVWPNANWYEREVWDMFGISFDGHPNMRRILMPFTWEGHPLRKEHPARATEMGPYRLPDEKLAAEEEALVFRPEEWGMAGPTEGSDYMFLNLGPQHPGTHGVFRLVLRLDGEIVVDCVPDIGYHHRAAEKMGERQTWHTYIPYTDRVDYLGGVTNNFPYVLSVEKLAGIEVPERAQVIRVMMAEIYRISSHLVWYGTFAQDVGQLSPVFYMFNDRERLLRICEAICGGRLHPNWFRIGGVAQDLPEGWELLVREFLDYLPARLDEYDRLVMQNSIFRGRTEGIGAFSTADAMAWGATGPHLRATGMEWDMRKKRPYSMYDQFEFDIPTATNGDCYARALVRVEEMRQSLRIIEQCLEHMPGGEIKSRHPLTTPPIKERTMHDIETLINHFLNVSWGPVVPPGEASVITEGTKGMYAYHLVSDGNTHSYRTRIRTPSFAHIQMVPFTTRGHTISDLLSILGAVDFVLAEVDR